MSYLICWPVYVSQCMTTTVLGLLWVTETPNGSAWTESRYSFCWKSIVVQPGLSWTLLLVRFSRIHFISVHLSTISKMCACPSWSTVITSIFMFQKTRERSQKPRQKQGLIILQGRSPDPFILFCPSYWPELSHIHYPATKGAWKCCILPGGHMTQWTHSLFIKEGKNWPWEWQSLLYETLSPVLG